MLVVCVNKEPWGAGWVTANTHMGGTAMFPILIEKSIPERTSIMEEGDRETEQSVPSYHKKTCAKCDDMGKQWN
jgi:hypothetical protein